MIRKLIFSLMCVLVVFVSACSSTPDKVDYVADVTLEIRSGTLYVTPYNGPTYRTSVKADDINVVRPDIGTGQGGSMCSATIIKEDRTVATFYRSYVDDHKITRADLEEDFGYVIRVLSPMEIVIVISLSAVVCVIAVYKIRNSLCSKKDRIESQDLSTER